MSKLNYLFIAFNSKTIEFEQLPMFRAAIAKKVQGCDNEVLFHHHLDKNKLLYQYPLIQYKIINQQTAILCLEKGVDSFQNFLNTKDWEIKLGNKKIILNVNHLFLKQYNIQVYNKIFTYHINNWAALNTDNYHQFLNEDALINRIHHLEKILIAHILSFAKGVNITIEKPIKLYFSKHLKTRILPFKDIKLTVFDVEFKSNIFLPDYIGLGKASAYGFGVIKRIRQQQTIKAKNEQQEYERV